MTDTGYAPDRRSFLFLLGSGRAGGNTEALARRAADRLAPEVTQRWLRLSDLPLQPFVDLRHSGEGRFPEPTGNERVLLEATLEATDLVIASPLYWYSVSAATKLYLDHWAGWLHERELRFKERMRGKTMWAVSALHAEDHTKAGPLLGTLRNSAEYLDMNWGGGLLGSANRPGDILADPTAQAGARGFFDGAPIEQEPVRL